MTSGHANAAEMNAYWDSCSSKEFALKRSFVRVKVEEGNTNSSFEALPSDAERIAGVLAEYSFFDLRG